MAPASPTIVPDVLKEINDKYEMEQKAIKPTVFTNPRAAVAEESRPIKSMVIWTKAGSLVKSSYANVTINPTGFKNFDTGKVLVKWAEVKFENNNCKIENTGVNMSAVTDEVDNECCLKFELTNEVANLCTMTSYRCLHEANKIAKIVKRQCEYWHQAKATFEAYKQNLPKVTYDYLAFDNGKLHS